MNRTTKKLLGLVLTTLLFSSCGSDSNLAAPLTPTEPVIPASILQIMTKPRYTGATWSLLVTDIQTGQSFYPLNAERLSFTGSTRKLFSVGLAMLKLGPEARQSTTVHRLGPVDGGGVLDGDLVLKAGGDLTFGGRRNGDEIAFTDFDHNDANGLGTAILTPQDPLTALNMLAQQVASSGVSQVTGDVVVDARLFQPYRVPNGNLLITPIMVNENQIDVTVTPRPGQSALVTARPLTDFFTVQGAVDTVAAGSESEISFSGGRLTDGVGGNGTVQGQISVDYRAPLSGESSYVGTFRAEDPESLARVAFIEALELQGVQVLAPTVAPNQPSRLPAFSSYPADSEIASYSSAPWFQHARLILKVSLNLGANLALSLFGLTDGETTVQGALAAERATLISEVGIDGSLFSFPTNGSGTPDSQAAPRALVQLLLHMARSPVGAPYQQCLPVLGVDGSLAPYGQDLPGRGRVFAKPGTSILPDDQGNPQLKAMCLAGYIETRSGRKVAYALMVNDAGPVTDIESDVGGAFQDQAEISSLIFETL